MTRLSLSFLGPFQVTLDGQPVTRFESAKVRALLAYLAVEADHPHPREVLAGLLWPDWPQSSALANLRYALSDLRQCIGDRAADPPFLVISREEIGWNPSSSYELDVDTFGQRARDPGPGSGEDDDVVDRLASCVPLYRGSFLEGLSLGDSPAFEEWLRAQREHLEQRFLALLQRLGEHYERTGDYAQAQRYAQRQVELDPLREEAQRRLMRALALGGDRNAALARYQAYRATLAQELGAEPAPETAALCEQIRKGTLAASLHAPNPGVSESPSLPFPESPRPLFVAREQELAHLERWLEEALRGQGRVGFVVGEPGSGKSDAPARVRPPGDGGTPRPGGGGGQLQRLCRDRRSVPALRGGAAPAHRRCGGPTRRGSAEPRACPAAGEVAPETLRAVLQVGPVADRCAAARRLASGAGAGLARRGHLGGAGAGGAQPPGGGTSQASLFDHVTRVLQAVAQEHGPCS